MTGGFSAHGHEGAYVRAQTAGSADIHGSAIQITGDNHGGIRVEADHEPSFALAQLPHDIKDFTGRSTEVARLESLARSGKQPAGGVTICVITGTAGVGKSALAVHLAHRLSPLFPDAQLHVDLHGHDERERVLPRDALSRFLRRLGVPGEQIRTNEEERAELYRSRLAGRRALVLIDNATTGDDVRPLLPGRSTALVLVTSRNRLGGLIADNGAQPLRLDVFDEEEAVRLLGRVAGRERITRERDAATAVVRLCGHLPLAIRIVGSNLALRPQHGLAGVATQLSDEGNLLRKLQAGDVNVRASFVLSYRHLDEPAARMFRLSGMIPGPSFTAEVAAALAGTTVHAAGKLLESLLDANLLEEPTAPGRYRFHDLLRLYARERAHHEESQDERGCAVRRLLQWYVDTAYAANELVKPARRRVGKTGEPTLEPAPFDRREGALAWLDAELPNLVAATQQAAHYGFDDLVWRFPDALASFFIIRKHYVNWRQTCELGIAAADRLGDRQALACVLNVLGIADRYLRRFAEARENFERSRTLFAEQGDHQGAVHALIHLGSAYYREENPKQALPLLREALKRAVKYREPYLEGHALQYLGLVRAELGNTGKAVEAFERSLTLHRELDDQHRECQALNNLGERYRVQGRLDEALARFGESATIASKLGSRREEAEALHHAGLVYGNKRYFGTAIEYLRESLRLRREIEDHHDDAQVLGALGFMLERYGRHEEARECHREAQRVQGNGHVRGGE